MVASATYPGGPSEPSQWRAPVGSMGPHHGLANPFPRSRWATGPDRCAYSGAPWVTRGCSHRGGWPPYMGVSRGLHIWGPRHGLVNPVPIGAPWATRGWSYAVEASAIHLWGPTGQPSYGLVSTIPIGPRMGDAWLELRRGGFSHPSLRPHWGTPHGPLPTTVG